MMRNPTDITQTPEPNNNTGFMGMGFMMKKPEEAPKEEKVSTKKFCTFCGEKIMGGESEVLQKLRRKAVMA